MKLRLAEKNDLDSLVRLRRENSNYHASLMPGSKLKYNAKDFLIEHTQKTLSEKMRK